MNKHCQFVKCSYCKKDAQPNENGWVRFEFGLQEKKTDEKVYLVYIEVCPDCFEERIITVRAVDIETI